MVKVLLALGRKAEALEFLEFARIEAQKLYQSTGKEQDKALLEEIAELWTKNV